MSKKNKLAILVSSFINLLIFRLTSFLIIDTGYAFAQEKGNDKLLVGTLTRQSTFAVTNKIELITRDLGMAGSLLSKSEKWIIHILTQKEFSQNN